MNHIKEKNTVGVLDEAAVLVLVAKLRSSSVDDIKLAFLEDNYETTITNNSAYSPGMIIFLTDQL